jgi:hypothetical protein
MASSDIATLTSFVRARYSTEALQERTVVVYVQHGNEVWTGPVEVFSLAKHPTASTAYAWSDSTHRNFAVLAEGTTISACSAIEACFGEIALTPPAP